MIEIKNRNRKFLKCFLCFFLLIVACQKKSKNQSFNHINTDIISISFENSYKWEISDFFKISKVIALDSKNPVSEVNKLVFYKEKIFILDIKSKSVLRFSNNGTLEMKIHSVGKGPEEYLDITDFIIDDKSDDIIILDGVVGKQIVRYDWNGYFKAKQNISFTCVNFEATKDGYIMYCGNHQSEENTIDNNSFNDIIICDSNFHILKSIIQTSSIWRGIRYIFRNNTVFLKYGESIYCQLPMPNDNTIYLLKNDILKPRYKFDFGVDLMNLFNEKKSVKEILLSIRKFKIPHNLNDFFENDKIIYFAILKGREVKQVIYEKSKKMVYSRSISIDKYDKYFSPIGYHGDGAYIVHVLMPFMISGHEIENYIPIVMRDTIKSEDNPILVFFSIK